MTHIVIGFDVALQLRQGGLQPAARHVLRVPSLLQRHAWQMAAELVGPDPWTAECLALTRRL